MFSLATVLLVSLVSFSAAWPAGHFRSYHQTFNPTRDEHKLIKASHFNLRDYPYRKPGPNDVRSPCPWLSTCANHGIIPRDGKNIHFESMFRCAHLGGFSKTLFRTSRAGLIKINRILGVRDAAAGKRGEDLHPIDRMSLDETGVNGPIEHDLSITRYDIVSMDPKVQNLAEDAKPNKELVRQMLELGTRHEKCRFKVTPAWLDSCECGVPDDACYLDIEDMGVWFQERRRQEDIRHAQLGIRPVLYPFRDLLSGSGEDVFMLELMGRKGRISVEHAKMFLLYERIPCDWKPPPRFHFPKFMAKLTKMIHSFYKRRPKSTASLFTQDYTKEVDKMSAPDIHRVLISDHDKPGQCTGDDKACPPYKEDVEGKDDEIE